MTRDTEFSRIAENFLSLNLNKTKTDISIERLEKSVSSLGVSESNSPSVGVQNKERREIINQKMAFLREVFSDDFYIEKELDKKYEEQMIPPMIRPLPISPMAWAGSISSGQPIALRSSPLNSTAAKETTTLSVSTTEASPIKESTEPKHESLFSVRIPSVTSMGLNLGSTKSQTAQTTTPSLSNSESQNVQFSPQSLGTKAQNAPKIYPSVPLSSAGSVTATNLPVTTQQTAFVAPTSSINIKGFSFASIATTQAPPVFSSSPNFGPSSVNPLVPSSGFSQATPGKTFTATAPLSSTKTPNFGKNEVSQSLPPSTVSSPLKVMSPENSFVSVSPTSTPSSPLASLSSLVCGIEPLKPDREPSSSPNKSQAPSETSATVEKSPSQPFLFQVSNPGENKEVGIYTQKTNIFSSSVENKQEPKEAVVSPVKEGKTDNSDVRIQFQEAMKKLSFDSAPQKTIFGGAPTSVPQGIEAAKSGLPPKSLFSAQNQTSTSFFGTTNTIAESPQNQKSLFGVISSLNATPNVSEVESEETLAKIISTADAQTENNSPVIEVSLPPPKSGSDSKTSLEKLSSLSAKGITITKVGSTEKNSTTEETQLPAESDAKPTSSFGTLNFGLFTTPTKSTPSIFGGSSPKSPVTLDIAKPEVGFSEDQKVHDKSVEAEKQPETTKAQNLFGGASEVKTATTTSFTFSTSTLQTPTSTTAESGLQPQQSSGFSFGLKLLADTATTSTAATTASQTASSFSFAQAVSPPSSTGFTFAVPVTVASTSAASTFGFGNISTSFSDDKSNTGFSFAESQLPASTSTNIFGGFSSKPSDTTSVFGQTTDTTGGSNSLFGTPASSTDIKKSIFGTPVSSSETKNVFGTLTINTETKSIFGAPTSGAETKSIFGAPTSGAETKSIFGAPTSGAETKSIFGAPTSGAETKSIFGQTPVTTASAQPEFSFSLSTSTTTGQSSFFGAPAATTASFFGQPVCSPTLTSSSPFGQPITTPSVFGSTTSSVFGGTPAFGSKSTFGQSGGSFFGQTSGGFGSTSGGSVFGGSSPPAFGSNNAQSASPFGQSSGGSGSIFGGASFSTGGQSVGQTGFSTASFQNKPAFGTTSPPAFGAAPAFGGSPSFGSPPKLFGSPSAAPTAFGGANQQQSSTFENLANQNTMTFGNLAQNQGFGSMFSPNQSSPPPAPAFTGQNPGGSMFGGSSFSSWR